LIRETCKRSRESSDWNCSGEGILWKLWVDMSQVYRFNGSSTGCKNMSKQDESLRKQKGDSFADSKNSLSDEMALFGSF
jgi:hypothetical protein